MSVSERAIKKLTLPDGSYLEYDYDDGIGRPNPLGIASVSGSGGGGTISFTYGATVYSKTRLRTVKRKSAAGTTLWSRKYLYEDSFFPLALTGIEDSTGQRLTTYTYDALGDVLSTESAGGADRHEFTRTQPSSTRLVRTVKGPLGHVATYDFDIPATIKRYSIAKLLSVKGDANGSVAADELSYSYSGNRIASVTDRRGTATSYANDPTFGRPTLVNDAAGDVAEQQTGITWHPVWDLPMSEQRAGLRIDSVYDAQGRRTSTTATDTTAHSLPYATAGQSRTTSYSWTAQGKLAQINGPLSPDAQGRDDTTSFVYDTGGNLTGFTDALGHVTGFAGHDANGRPASMTDANGMV
ncbi:MAG: RHS repeat domain-containing protein, partial [Gammaproteobacteria bacterium]